MNALPPGTKPCQFCGAPVLTACAVVGCVACQRYNARKFHDARPWLTPARKPV